MNYRKRRSDAGLSVYTVSKELGISYEKYLEVDRGERDLEGELVDKFLNAIERAKEINFNRMQKMKDVNEWFVSGQARKDIENANYTQKTLADAIGVGINQGSLCLSLKNNGDKRSLSDDAKERVYDFLHDPINKNIVKKPKFKVSNVFNKKAKEKLPEITPIEVGEPEEMIEEVEEVKTNEISVASETIIKSLKEENERLKRQISLYEKLIERL